MKRILSVAMVLFSVVACGAGTTSPPSGSVSSEQDQERARQFAQCMRDHGVDMADPGAAPTAAVTLGPGQRPSDDDKTTAALDACRAYLPNGGELSKPDAQQIEQARRYAQCMREHGVANFPDPDSEGGLDIGHAGVSPNDSTFKAADEACKDLRPAPVGAGAGR